MKFFACGLIVALGFAEALAAPLTTTFTYQGELNASNQPANGAYDFEFQLYDQETGGLPLALVPVDDVQVTDGIFTVGLDFGASNVVGDRLWLELSVRDGASTGGYVGLLPRQEVTAAPYALHAERVAMNAVGSSEIDTSQVQRRISGNCTAGSFVQTVNQDGTVECADPPASYSDAQAVAAMGTLANSNPLNHERLTSVTSAEIVNGTVTTVDLADSAVSPSKLDATGDYTVNDLTINGATEIAGRLDITGFTDIRIMDDTSGLRWFNSAGTDQQAAIIVGGSTVAFSDENQGRTIFSSNTTGIGIGTQSPVSSSAVTIPSLNVSQDQTVEGDLTVEGSLEVGLSRVEQTYALTDSNASCDTYGGNPCFFSSTTISCPVGTRIVGGGIQGSGARFASIGNSYPNSDTSWTCSSSIDISGQTDRCFALCARLQ
ncbi:MAG: hypothetical protein AB8B96_20355 [Lysobacterales bacterium]